MKPKPEIKSGTVVTVGRHRDNSIVLDDHLISNEHAQIIIQDDIYYIRDLDSSHGTCVNGKPVTMVRLKGGDVVSFGSSAFSFEFSMEDNPFSQGTAEPEERIDLSEQPRARKIAWNKSEEPLPSNILPFPGQKETGAAKTDKSPSPKPRTIGETAPDSSTPQGGALLKSWLALRKKAIIVASVCVALLALNFYRSWAMHKHAFEAGYQDGLEEFENPPRNLDMAMIQKFAKPAAFRLEINEAYYGDFTDGMKEACFKTYMGRFHVGPHLGD